MRKTKEERVIVIDAGGDEAVNKDRSGQRGKGGAETSDVA